MSQGDSNTSLEKGDQETNCHKPTNTKIIDCFITFHKEHLSRGL